MVIRALETLESDKDPETAKNAMSYGASIQRSDSIIALWVTVHCFQFSVHLSKILQTKNLDFSIALENVHTLTAVLKDMRASCDLVFDQLFEDAESNARKLQIEIKMPRLCGKQANRNNVESTNPRDYYRRSIFIPFLDHFIEQMESRFNSRMQSVIPLEGLIPDKITKYTTSVVVTAGMIYKEDINVNENQLRAELLLWKQKWKGKTVDIPSTAVVALSACDDLTPSIRTLLLLLATLPVTTATAERSFSTLRRLKSYLRSTMLEDRLNGFAMVNIHHDIEIDHQKVIDRFVSVKPRRMQLKDWS